MSLCSVTETSGAIDSCIPAHIWNKLSQDDQIEYLRLRVKFHQQQRSSGKDSRVASFHNELLTARSYIERRQTGKEERSIICGVCFAGRYICINTRLLKYFLGRCKSSINGSIQQMGYVALKTKTKARNCVLAVMHSLVDDVNNLRQWTVRCVSDSAMFAIVSSFPDAKIPEIYDSDLNLVQIQHSNNSNQNHNQNKNQNHDQNKENELRKKLNLTLNFPLNISKITQITQLNQIDFSVFHPQNISYSTVNPLPNFDDSLWVGDISSIEPIDLGGMHEWDSPSSSDGIIDFFEPPRLSLNITGETMFQPTDFF